MNSGHRDRIKKQFINDEFNNMQDYHVLELLLFYAIPRCDTKQIAHRLIDTFGSFTNVFDADIHELIKVDGIKEHSAVLIKMIPKITRRYMEEKTSSIKKINNVEDAAKFLIPKFIGVRNEQVYVICLNQRAEVIYSNIVYEGTISAAQITSRKIAEVAIRVGANCVIISHNHPNSFATPSREDIFTTDSIKESLKQVGVTLFDHIIIAGEDFTSMAECGLIKRDSF